METIKKHVVVIVFFLLFSFLGIAILDPDLGWRLQMGRLILTSGIPKTDPFSFTMMRYPFIDHEWLTHTVVYVLFLVGGRGLLSVLFALIACLALFLDLNDGFDTKKAPLLFFGMFFLAGASIMGAAGVRPQVAGWLLLVLWVRELRRKKTRLPILFALILFWVNVHGSFFLGIATLFLFLCFKHTEKKLRKKDALSFFFIILITGFNPYGFRIWREVFASLFDVSLRWRIQEWVPGIFVFDIAFWIYAAFYFSVLMKFWRFTSPLNRWFSVLFFGAALSAARNMPLFILVSVFSFGDMWIGFVKSVPKEKQKALSLLSLTLALLFIFVGAVRIGKILSDIKPVESVYPKHAIEFIKHNRKERRIFAEYGWGGYVLWQLPEANVFIDGRMPSWKWRQTNPNQSNNAEDEYEQVMLGKKPIELFQKKYAIEIALVKPDKKKIFKTHTKIYEDATSVVYILKM